MIFVAPKWCLLLCTLFLSALAQAEVRMNAPTVWQRAQVLTVGQQVWSISSSYQNFTDQYSANGRVQGIGSNLSRAVTWNQLVAADQANGSGLQAYMQQHNLNGDSVAATETYAISRQEVELGLNWAYGLTSHWMIGVQIPVSQVTTHVQQSVTMSPDLVRGTGTLRATAAAKTSDVQGTVKQLAAEQLMQSGYDRIPTQRQSWDFEDISLLSQFALVQGYNWNWSLQQMVRLPTAQNPNVDDYVQMSEDEGPIDIGAASLLDYRTQRWLFGLRFGYVAQLPDTASMRVDAGEADEGIDPKVNRHLGDWYWGAVDADFHISRRLVFLGEYSYLAKQKDHYSGSVYDASDYTALAQDTDQQLSQARVGVIYRLGSQSVRDGVTHKWVAALDYTYPLSGRNAYEAPRAALELMDYF